MRYIFILLFVGFSIGIQAQNLFPYRYQNKWGFCDSSKNIVIKPQFEFAVPFTRMGLARVKLNGLYGFVDSTGCMRIPALYQYARDFYFSTTWVYNNGHYTIIDTAGNCMQPDMYDAVRYGKYAIMAKKISLTDKEEYRRWKKNIVYKTNNSFLARDESGDYMKYVSLEGFESGQMADTIMEFSGKHKVRVMHKKDTALFYVEGMYTSKWYLLDLSGRKLSNKAFDEIKLGSALLVPVKKNGKWGYASIQDGRMKVRPEFEDALGFSEMGFAPVQQGGKWGIIDTKGHVVIPCTFDDNKGIEEDGICWVQQNNKWGLLNCKTKKVSPFEFDEVSYFKEDLAYVKKNNKYGFIDKNGKTIIPFIFYQAFEFREGLAEVCYSADSCGYINKDGIAVIPFQYDINCGGRFYEGLAEVMNGSKVGFINIQGDTIVPLEYYLPYDYNSFDEGMGCLLVPDENGKRPADFKNSMFYFNRRGTLFFDE